MFQEPEDEEAWAAAAKRLRSRLADVEVPLTAIGVHVTEASVVPWSGDTETTFHPALMFIARVGDLAFAPRVQHPEQEAINDAAESFRQELIDFDFGERLRAFERAEPEIE